MRPVADTEVSRGETLADDASSPSMDFLRALASPGTTSVEPPRTSPVGRLVAGRFDVRREIGRGGFGAVYEAVDVQTGLSVALKRLRRKDPTSIAMLKNEHRSLSGIAHPNLVRIDALFFADDELWLAMEHIEGRDLGTRLDAIGAMPREARFAFAREVLVGVAHGLAHLHARAKVHRDVKPSNVIVTPDGRVVLLDFGLVADRERPHVAAGTRRYMAPELESEAPATSAADLYAAGVLLSDLLPPEREDDASELRSIGRMLLAQSPAERPTAAALITRLGGRPEPSPHSEGARFFGRGELMARLEDSLARASEGHAEVVLVAGGAGTGKTAYLDAIADHVSGHARAPWLLRGRCHAHETVPYATLDAVIDSLAFALAALPAGARDALWPSDHASLVALFPVLGRGLRAALGREVPATIDALDERRRAFAAFRALFTNLTRDRAAVVLIDDIHFGDVDGLELLLHLVGGANPPSIVLVASIREVASEPSTAFVRRARDALAALPITRVETLGRLAPPEARALVRALAPEASDAHMDAIVHAAEGIPLYLTELGVAAASSGAGDEVHDLETLIRDRFLALDEASKRVLSFTVIAARPTLRSVLLAAAFDAPSRAPAASAIAILEVNRLLLRETDPRGEAVRAYHAAVENVVLAHTDAGARAAIHVRLVDALEALGIGEPEELFHHTDLAGDTRRAAEHAERAARRAEDALAFDRATTWLHYALAHGEFAPTTRATLGARLARALRAAGRPHDAARAYLAAAAYAGRVHALELRRRAMEQLFLAGYPDEATEVLEGLVTATKMPFPTTRIGVALSIVAARVRLRVRGRGFTPRDEASLDAETRLRIDTCWAATMGMMLQNPLRTADLHTRHLLLALDAGEPRRVARAFALEAHIAVVRGASERSSASLLADARALAIETGDPYTIGITHLAEGTIGASTGQFGRALGAFELALAHFNAPGVEARVECDLANVWLATMLFRSGEAVLFRALIETLRADARARGNAQGRRDADLFGGVLVALLDDDPDRAERAARDGLIEAERLGSAMGRFRALQLATWVELYRDAPVRALTFVDRAVALSSGAGLVRAPTLRIDLLHCRINALIALDDPRSVARARRDVDRIVRIGTPFAHAVAETARARFARREGEDGEAIARLESAEHAYVALGAMLLATCAKRRRGLWLRDEGRALVLEADAWLMAHGFESPERIDRCVLGPERETTAQSSMSPSRRPSSMSRSLSS